MNSSFFVKVYSFWAHYSFQNVYFKCLEVVYFDYFCNIRLFKSKEERCL